MGASRGCEGRAPETFGEFVPFRAVEHRIQFDQDAGFLPAVRLHEVDQASPQHLD